MQHLNIIKFGWTVSIFVSLAYVVCFFWGVSLAGDLKALHLDILRLSYLQFAGMDAVSFISGLVQTFVWGWLGAAVFGWLWNQFHK